MRRKLTFWRVFAVLVAIVAVVGAGARSRGRGERSPRPRRLHRPRQDRRAHPRRQRARRGARAARRSRSAKAVIVHIDSPGGTTAGSEQLHDALRGSRPRSRWWWSSTGSRPRAAISRRWRPTTSWRRSTSLVGSIGVLFQYPNVTELLKTVGVKVEEIKSSPLKAAPERLRADQPGGARRDRGAS